MAIEVKVNGEQEVKREYPYLGRHGNGDIVLFTGVRTGTRIESKKGASLHHGYEWNEYSFTPISPSESITLSNKA